MKYLPEENKPLGGTIKGLSNASKQNWRKRRKFEIQAIRKTYHLII